MAADPVVTTAGQTARGPGQEEALGRRGPRSIPAAIPRGWLEADRLTSALAIGSPALLTIYLSFSDGGYFPLPPAVGAGGLAVLLALRMLCMQRTDRRPSVGFLMFLAAIGLLAAWTLLSGSWSHSPGRALIAYDLTVMYALAAAVAGSVSYTPSRLRLAVYVVFAAMVVVCVAAFVAGAVPELWRPPRTLYSSRLGFPLNYPNALGILAAVATVLGFHLSCCPRGSRRAHVAAAALTPLAAVTLYMTLSRGAAWSAVLALVVYVALGRPRALAAGLVAVLPPTVVALAATYLIGFHTPIPSGSLIPGGHSIAAVVAAAMTAAGVLRHVGLERRLVRWRIKLPTLVGRRRLALTGVLAVLLAAGTAVYVDRLAHEPASQTPATPLSQGAGRLTSVNPDGRLSFWKVALKDFRAQPVHGLGAGMYSVSWTASTVGDTIHHDAQSLYLQTLAELGIVGLALLLAVLGTLAVGLIRRARATPDRALFVAILAAGLAWAVSAGVDWDWQMPAVTLWLFALGGLALSATASPTQRPRRATTVLRLPVRAAVALGCLGLAVTPVAMALSEYRLHQSIRALTTSCPQASAAARSSLAAIGSRAEPHQILGFCDLGAGRPEAALREMREGLSVDPQNWQLEYGFAVATAANGHDPRGALMKTDRLAPLEPLVIRGILGEGSYSQTNAGWRQWAADTWVPLPLVPLAPNNGPQLQEGIFPGSSSPPPLL